MRESYNSTHSQRAKKAYKRLHAIAGRQVQELVHKLDPSALTHYEEFLQRCRRATMQGCIDKNKIYSLHKPFTACIAKSKTV